MTKERSWASLALKASKKVQGFSQKAAFRLTQTFKVEDFIKFSQSHNEDLLRLAEVLQKVFQKCASVEYNIDASEDTALAMDTALLSLKMISALRGYADYRIIAGCLFPHVAEFIRSHLNLAVAEGKKSSMPPMFFALMAKFQNFVNEVSLFLPNLHYFLESCVESALSANPKIYQKNLLLIISFFEINDHHQPILSGILNYIAKKKKNVFHTLGNFKVSSTTMLIVVLIQHGLSFHPNSETCFETAFSFAAQFLTAVRKKCADKVQYMIDFFESFIKGLLQLVTFIDWPGARLLFHMIAKVLALYITEKSDYGMMKFALRQMPKVGKVIRKMALTWEELTLKISSAGFTKNHSQIVKSLLSNFNFDVPIKVPILGDISKANNVLWEHLKRPKDNTVPPKHKTKCEYQLNPSEAGAAAFYLDFYKISYSLYARHVLSAISCDKQEVRIVAVKSLSDMIVFEPRLLLLPYVAEVIDECLASASMKKAIANAMGAFFDVHPTHIVQFRLQFLRLLEDPVSEVRLAAVKAISPILKKPELLDTPAISELLVKVIPLADDEDVAVHQAVVNFFKTAWLGNDNNIESLINVCKQNNMVNYIGTLLSTLQCHQRVVCQSQLQTAKPDVSQEELGESVKNLTETLAVYLSSGDLELDVKIMAILRTVAKVTPFAVEPHVDLILSKLDFLNETGKRLAAETLRSVLAFCSENVKSEIAVVVRKELEGNESFGWQVTTLAMFLKLFLSVARKEEMSAVVATGLEIVEAAQISGHVENVMAVKKALCVIYVLCPHDRRKDSLLRYFIKEPEYKLTLFSIACQVRLDIVRARDCAFLEAEVRKFLDKQSHEELIVAALYFIYCTLHGYKRQVQESSSIKKLGQSTTETVSDLLQSCLDKILACSVHSNEQVRKGCSSVMALIVESGLILMPRLLPHICAMTADPLSAIRSSGKKLLSRAAESWDISLSIVKGLSLAYSLAKSLNPGIVRGFDTATGTATFQIAYAFIQESPVKRRKFLGSIVSELFDTHDVLQALYIADQIAGLPFHYADEVLYALSEISRLVALHIGEKSFSMYLLKKVARLLAITHKFTHEKVAMYSPNTKSTETLRQPSDFVDYIDKEVLNKIIGHHFNEVDEKLPESDQDSDSDEDDIPLAALRQKKFVKEPQQLNASVAELNGSSGFTRKSNKENADLSARERKKNQSGTNAKAENRCTPEMEKELAKAKISLRAVRKCSVVVDGMTPKEIENAINCSVAVDRMTPEEIENAINCSSTTEKTLLPDKIIKRALKSRQIVGNIPQNTMTAPKRAAVEPGRKYMKKKLKVLKTPVDDILHG